VTPDDVTTRIIFGTTPGCQGSRVIETSFEDLAGQTNSGDWKILSPDEAQRLKRALQRQEWPSEAGSESQP